MNKGLKNISVRGLLIGAIGASCWGFSAVSIDFLTSHYDAPADWIGLARLTIAAVCFAVLGLTRNRENVSGLLHDRKSLLLTALFALIGLAFYQIVWVFAIRNAGAPADALIAQTGQVYVMIFACVQGRRHPRVREVVSLVLALFGVFCIATKGDVTTLAIGGMGLFWCLMDGVFLFLHNVIPLKPLAKYGSAAVNTVGMVIGAAILFFVAHPWTVTVNLDALGVGALFVSAIVGAVIGYVLCMRALLDAGVVAGSMVLVFEPLSAVVLSAILLGHAITFFDVIGIICICAMVILLALDSDKA